MSRETTPTTTTTAIHFQSIDLVGWARSPLTVTYHWSDAKRWQIRTQMHARIFGSRANVVLFFGKFVVERDAVKIERTM